MKRILCILFAALTASASAQSYQEASQKVQQDLSAALEQLAEVRNDIADQQIGLSREVNTLENEVIEKTREVERLQRQADNRDVGISGLRQEVQSRRDEIEYISGLLNEFVRNFETKIHISETQLYEEAIKEARLSIEDVNLSRAEKLDLQVDIVNLAVDRMDNVLGGMRYEGKALTEGGVLESGAFAAIGPTVFFMSETSDAVGLSMLEVNSADSVVVTLKPVYDSGIISLIETGEGTIPADASLGNALKMEQTRDSIGEHVAKGGLWGYIIISLGAIAALLAFFKIGDISGVKMPKVDDIQGMLYDLDAGNEDAAAKKAEAIPGMTGKVFQDAVANVNQRRSVLEEIMFARLLEIRPRLERYLAFLALVAAAAPLLGLLGTVTGMIKTFNLITIFGTGDAKKLSSGISEALVTTELGLAVAIPVLLIHGLLNRMAKRKMADLEQGAVAFLNGLEVQKES